MIAAAPVAPVAPAAVPPTGATVPAARQSARFRSRPVARVPALSRAEEYGFIQTDLRRLVLTAVPLLALMIGLLFVVER